MFHFSSTGAANSGRHKDQYFHFSYGFSQWGRSVTCTERPRLFCNFVFLMYTLPVFDTTSPGNPGGILKPRMAARHGNFTPPRISPSCPHCLRLWLDRSTNAGAVMAKQACQFLFWGRMDPLCTLSWPSLMWGIPTQVVLAHPPVSLTGSSPGTPADVSQFPDMQFSTCTRGKENPLTTKPVS